VNLTISSRRVLRLVAIAGLASGAVVLPATAAQATPSNCSGRYDLHSYSVYCGRGTGEFQARVRCYRYGSDNYRVAYGPWRRAGRGALSTASCLASEDPASGNWHFR
jgi:hypothetical protein